VVISFNHVIFIELVHAGNSTHRYPWNLPTNTSSSERLVLKDEVPDGLKIWGSKTWHGSRHQVLFKWHGENLLPFWQARILATPVQLLLRMREILTIATAPHSLN
jgi:hypothetical protein